MTIEAIPGTDVQYYLLSYNDDGDERNDDPEGVDGRLSTAIRKTLVEQPVSDVFFISHGWKGDVPAAIDQYERWIGAMLACEPDRESIRASVPEFQPMLICIHWPSLPWGEEDQTDGYVEFDVAELDFAAMKADAAAKIADTDAARAALDTIFAAAIDDPEPAALPDGVAEAFRTLAREAGLEGQGPGAPPGADAEPFDPETAYAAATSGDNADLDFGIFSGIKNGILGVLRQLSFWKMKKRARVIGERGAGTLLRDLQAAVPAGRTVRFHLMGHSFGCIVISATINGAPVGAPLPKPVDAVYLVQGALSFWSYCSTIPHVGSAGYFHPIVAEGKVAGPLLTTHSAHDTAVGKLYPIAAGVAGQVEFGPKATELPKYGALGTFGARGPNVQPNDVVMGGVDANYGFKLGQIYNLNADDVINEGDGASGAHNDIDKPAVAHAFWAAVKATL